MTSKECTKCGLVKPLSEFGNHRLTKDKHAYRCKRCAREHARAYSETPAGIWGALNAGRRHYQKKPVLISKDDFVEWYNAQPKKCAYCDIPEDDFVLLRNRYGSRAKRLTIDSKDNSVGYEVENMVLACERCNFIKSNILSFDEMRYIGLTFIRPKWKALKRGELSESIYLKRRRRNTN